MDDPGTPVPPTNGNGQMSAILKILGIIGIICAIGLVAIGVFSVYLRMLPGMPGGVEAGASVGAVRENLMAVLMAIVGALAMKAKGGP